MFSSFAGNLLTLLAEAGSTDEALRQIDLMRRVVAGPGVFSVNLNVTTAQDATNEIKLRRLYSSDADQWPVTGTKRKTPSEWTETIFVKGQISVSEGAHALERSFDDHVRMRERGLNSAINVPLMKDGLCYATFNVFGKRAHWFPHEIEGVRLLALAASRWIPCAPDLAYSLDSSLLRFRDGVSA
jgi:hypothetical protein